jgi:CheY-like chemotaxis protein
MPEGTLRVLVVDNDSVLFSLIARILRVNGFNVESADSTTAAANLMRSFQPQLLLVEVQLPEMPPERLIQTLRRNAPRGSQLVLYSASNPEQLRRLAELTGADAHLSKTEDRSKLPNFLRTLASKQSARK